MPVGVWQDGNAFLDEEVEADGHGFEGAAHGADDDEVGFVCKIACLERLVELRTLFAAEIRQGRVVDRLYGYLAG